MGSLSLSGTCLSRVEAVCTVFRNPDATRRKAVIATGGSPTLPVIPGIDGTLLYTNQTIFNLTELPPRLAVIGAGPIGLELAQVSSQNELPIPFLMVRAMTGHAALRESGDSLC
jgi:NAD(P)H-nitrite reductase large subunit